MEYREGQRVELTLGDVAHGGWCVARPDGAPVVFVRHGLPGERVVAQITGTTARFARADAVAVIEQSPDRVSPPCPHARPGGCGGCDWQHASLDAQRALKATVITQQLRRLAGLDRSVTVEPLPGAGGTAGLGWRTRVQFAIGSDGTAGLRAHRSHHVIDVGECLIAHPAVTALGITARRWPRTAAGASVAAVVAAGTGQRAVIVTGTGPDAVPGIADTVPGIADTVLVRRRRGGKLETVRGTGFLTRRAAGRDWRVSAAGFWQVHPAAADVLSAAVVDALRPRPGALVLDLYCGAGLFAGVLAAPGARYGARPSPRRPGAPPDASGSSGTGSAHAAVRVIGIEADAAAVRDARHNLGATGRVHRGDVAEVLRSGGLPPARLVVADPPRAGLAGEVIGYLSAPDSGAERFAYVSCDPATLARDIGLLRASGWTLAALRAFDAFPMTHHVECLATLTRPGRAQEECGQRDGAPRG